MTLIGLVLLLLLIGFAFKYFEPYVNSDMLRLAVFVIVFVVFILLLQTVGFIHIANIKIGN